MKDFKIIFGALATCAIVGMGIFMSFIYGVKADEDVELVWVAVSIPVAAIVWNKYVAPELPKDE